MKIAASLSIVMTLILSGCAVGERTVSLEPGLMGKSGEEQIATADLKGTVDISSIADKRVFQNKPKEPSTPSIDGDVADLTPEMQIRMIGRQRGGYGNALGDTVLPEGSSVIVLTRGLLERGFAARGYKASDDPDATLVVNVDIDQFWSWVTPGMWSIKVEAKLAFAVTVTKGDVSTELNVTGYGIKGSSTAATSKTWEIVYDLAFDDAVKNLESELAKTGF